MAAAEEDDMLTSMALKNECIGPRQTGKQPTDIIFLATPHTNVEEQIHAFVYTKPDSAGLYTADITVQTYNYISKNFGDEGGPESL
jgi:hypothetical protein